MALCSNCGHQLADKAKFCSECGAPVEGNPIGEHKKREQIYVGVVKKCPVCGEELPSMAAVCPACGHEINSTQIHPALQKFIDDLAVCDQSIADEEAINTTDADRGWHSWNTAAKTLWVIVNCLTICVPIVVNFLFRSRRFRKTAPSVKRKANLIENFQIPSERQAIIETLYFIRDKASALATQKMTSDTVYWANLWGIKSEQIYKKAQTAIPNDVSVSGLYHETINYVQQVKSVSKRKNIFAILAAAIYIALVITVEALVINRISQIANIPGASDFLPIIWGVCAVLLLAFFVWTIRKIPDNLKGTISVAICVVALIFLVRGCQNDANNVKESAQNFTAQIGNKCNDYGMTLVNIDMNERKKTASIKIQISECDKPTIDKAEADIFAAAKEYEFELQIEFTDKDNLTIRESRLGEYGVVKHITDNTSGVLNFVKNKCIEYGAELDQIYNGYDGMLKFSIQMTTTDKTVMDNLQNDIFATKNQFGYSGYEIEFRTMDKSIGQLLRDVEIEANNSISLKEYIPTFDQAVVDEVIANATAKCKDQMIDMIIEVQSEDMKILWKSFVDSTGNQINVDVYHFRNEAKTICTNNGVTIDNIYIPDREISFNIYSDSRRSGKIDKIEEALISTYQTYSDLKQMSFAFWDKDYPSEQDKVRDMDLHGSDYFDKLEEVEEKNKIRDIEVDVSGIVSHNADNTTPI